MKYVFTILQWISYGIFVGFIVSGILGFVKIYENFGSAVIYLITPTILIIFMGIAGMYITYMDSKNKTRR